MPSEKRARQRAGRQAKLAAQAKVRKRKRRLRSGIVAVIVGGFVVGTVYLVTHRSSSAPTTPRATTQAAADQAAVAAGCPRSPATRVNSLHFSAPPPTTISSSKTYTATVRTTAGTFVITLDAKAAPQTVNNFVFLANHGFYRCNIFHRVIPAFVDQTGDPTGKGTGGPGYTIPDEYPPQVTTGVQYPLGSVAMANTGPPHTGGSQWFVVTGTQGEQLPNTYSLFGRVTSGMNVVQRINSGGTTTGVPPRVTQRILSITVHSR